MDDPFASIIDQCIISSSQEEFLRWCPFFREAGEGLGFFSSEESSQPEEIPSAHPGIIMYSLPDGSDEDGSQPDEFQTAPEESLRMSGNERRADLGERVDARIGGAGDDVVVGATADKGGDSLDICGTVDLGKDSDIGFSKEKSLAERADGGTGNGECADIGNETTAGEVSGTELEDIGFSKGKSHDMGKPGFSKPEGETSGKSSSKILHVKENLNLKSTEAENAGNSLGESNQETCMGYVVTEKSSEPPTEKNLRRMELETVTPAVQMNNIKNKNDSSHEQAGEINLDKTEEKFPVKKNVEFPNSVVDFSNSMTEVLQSEVPDGFDVPDIGKDKIRENSPLKATEEDMGLGFRTEKVSLAEDLDVSAGGDPFGKTKEGVGEFKYVEPISFALPDIPNDYGVRRLPESISGQVKKTTEPLVSCSSSSNDQLVRSLLETVNLLSGGRKHTRDDVDILETVKRRGITFPQPRWWRSGGY